MQEAFGGILNIVLVVVFLLIVEGVLGFTVSYTKAFKMKNSVISAIEEYESSGCFDNNSACHDRILSSAKKYGYSPTRLSCPRGFSLAYSSGESFFCYRPNNTDSDSYSNRGKSYHIITQVDIKIPVINNIMGFSLFQVSGDTRVVERQVD